MANAPPKLPSVNFSADRFNSTEYLIRDPKSIGRAVIINNDEWYNASYFPPRTGSKADVEKMEKALKHVGFKIDVINPENKRDIEKQLKDIAQDPSYTTEADIFMCVILSYGENGYFLDREEQNVYLSDIMKIFNGKNCPGLVMKPKIFIMQACDKKDARPTDRSLFALKKPGDMATIPQEADFLSYTSTVSGKYNWDDEKETYFIDCICNHLKEKPEIDFLKLTIDVNSKMDSYLRDLQKAKKTDFELPLCRSQLTKRLILKKL